MRPSGTSVDAPTSALVPSHPSARKWQRFKHLTVAFAARDVTLSWQARQQLMARLRDVASNARIRDSIQAVGTTGPVTLGAGQKRALLNVLRVWSLDREGYEPMPLELYKLRNVLNEDLGQSDA